MELEQKVRERIEYDARKHDLHTAQGMELDEFIDKKINGWSNTELLFYISLELGELNDRT